jgi:hypothetical protein
MAVLADEPDYGRSERRQLIHARAADTDGVMASRAVPCEPEPSENVMNLGVGEGAS